jgi:hypothetical protein
VQTRRILSCDGGGIRGIITLRCLEALEARFGPCTRHFHMFAGTSTGALIAGALAHGIPVARLIELYAERRREIFARTFAGLLHPLGTKYSAKGLRRVLKEFFGERRLAELDHDITITAVDTVRAETTYFSSFRLPGAGDARHGSYRDVRLRDAIQASAAAPTYFPAHGRFIDGGTTVYNNPAYMAAVEALRYSSDKKADPPQPSAYDGAPIEVYSFGTGIVRNEMQPGEAMEKTGFGWIKYVLNVGGDHANHLQSYVAQSELDIAQDAVTFYRYDLYMTPDMIEEARPGSGIDPRHLTLDAIDDESFALLDALGSAFAGRLLDKGLFDPLGTPEAPTSGEWQAGIVRRHNTVGRWVRYPEFAMPAGYVDEVLREFEAIDRKR